MTDQAFEYFHHDVGNPRIYDLVINTDNIRMECAVDLIAEQLRRCFDLKE